MFNSLAMLKVYIKSVSDVHKSAEKINGRVYVHLTRDSKSSDFFTVKLETNSFNESKAYNSLKTKYDRVVADLSREGYRTISAEPFTKIRDLESTARPGMAVYVKSVTFCRKDL